jgi:glycosyltransferase involved in cell wall biosynthesis
VLDDVDAGIIPSIWEEAYGLAGPEFLAKGIPVIANAMGGMPEYTRDGETRWLNQSCSAAELARIMREVVERPAQVAELNVKILAARETIIKPMARHGTKWTRSTVSWSRYCDDCLSNLGTELTSP